MTRPRTILLAASALCLFTAAHGQGCSDAGVCTAGPIGELALMNDSASIEPRHFARITISLGAGEQSTSVVQVVPEVSIGATDRLSFQLKVPYMSVSGNLGSTSGVADPTITGSYAFIKEDKRRLDALLGVKVNSDDAALKADDLPLPMPYQTSLSTTDLLLGINYRWKRISAAVAYQRVLAQNNENGFLRSAWAGGADSTAAAGYFESYALQRANDAVVRAQYAIPIGKLTLQPGLLGIMHLAEDTRGTGAPDAPRVTVGGSSGLTLNLTADARYKLNDRWAIEAAFGSPLVVREVRPDGLTRSMVVNVGVRMSF